MIEACNTIVGRLPLDGRFEQRVSAWRWHPGSVMCRLCGVARHEHFRQLLPVIISVVHCIVLDCDDKILEGVCTAEGAIRLRMRKEHQANST